MIGRLTIPKIANIEAYLSPFDLSSYAEFIIIKPTYMKRRINSEVSLASQTHHVPQVGLPQIDPVISVARVKQAPIGAQALIVISARACLSNIENNAQQAIIE